MRTHVRSSMSAAVRIDDFMVESFFPCLIGEIQKKGIVIPLAREFYHPILLRLKQEGIHSRELIEPR